MKSVAARPLALNSKIYLPEPTFNGLHMADKATNPRPHTPDLPDDKSKKR